MKSKQSALQSKVTFLALFPVTLEGPGCPGRWRPDRWRPRATPEDAAGAEAPSAHGQTRKGKTLGFTCLAVDRTERAQKKRKVIVGHKADLLFGKMNPGNALFPTRAMHCGQVSPSPAERGARADLGGSRCSSPLGRPPVWVATPLSRDGTSSSASRLSLCPQDPRRRPGAHSHSEKQAPARVINISEKESCDGCTTLCVAFPPLNCAPDSR